MQRRQVGDDGMCSPCAASPGKSTSRITNRRSCRSMRPCSQAGSTSKDGPAAWSGEGTTPSASILACLGPNGGASGHACSDPTEERAASPARIQRRSERPRLLGSNGGASGHAARCNCGGAPRPHVSSARRVLLPFSFLRTLERASSSTGPATARSRNPPSLCGPALLRPDSPRKAGCVHAHTCLA